MTESTAPAVLFVDDEPNITSALRASLRSSAFEIFTANSAREGLDVLANHPIDVVVSDERMPEMPGSAFLTRVREDHPATQRIVLTGEASLDSAIAAINGASIFRFLVKPCAPSDIEAAVLEALDARKEASGSTGIAEADGALHADFDAGLNSTRIVFQPILDGDRRLFAYEVLLRVDHPRFGSPLDLIDAATVLERRWELDRRVRRLVAEQLHVIPSTALLFVNLLPESILDEELVGDDDPLCGRRDRIVLEITERAPLDAFDDVEARLDAIRAAGFRLALDDLGAGYAGLTSLVTMRPDVVKFDMGLVRDVDSSPERSSLLGAMTVVSHELGALVLGEGIETDAEMAHLDGLGCDLFQGYLLGRPDALPH
jgi:EAL domain-containing protein (putative c-di-GMP-specific phosphodiesterase class I)